MTAAPEFPTHGMKNCGDGSAWRYAEHVEYPGDEVPETLAQARGSNFPAAIAASEPSSENRATITAARRIDTPRISAPCRQEVRRLSVHLHFMTSGSRRQNEKAPPPFRGEAFRCTARLSRLADGDRFVDRQAAGRDVGEEGLVEGVVEEGRRGYRGRLDGKARGAPAVRKRTGRR